MDDRALMQMASNALKNCRLLIYKWSDFAHDSLKKEEELASDIASLSLAIQSLDDRLAQPEPEPVAWREIMGKWKTHYYDYNEDGRGEPLYTAPREWVGLTEKEAWECWVSQDHTKSWQNIEDKLREKNND
jgi:hypothetical protein